MANLRLEQLQAHLERELRPLYVIHGDEPLLALEAGDAIRARARANGFSERLVLAAERGFDWNELGASGSSLSLFGDKKLIELRLASGKPGSDGAGAIEAFCAKLPPDALTLVTLPRLDKAGQGSPWFKALETKGVVVNVYPVERARLPEWIAARLARQKERGKLDARARLDLLLDPGTFREIGVLATHLGRADGATPADGVVCGTGMVDARPACVASYDFTVQGGSIGPVGERKVARLRELALRERIPMIWLVDSAGARLSADPEEAAWISSFADTGYLFREQVVMSGVVPQVAAMVGPGAAGTAYIPGLADFVPMVRGTSSIAIGGPYLVKSVVGEDVTRPAPGPCSATPPWPRPGWPG